MEGLAESLLVVFAVKNTTSMINLGNIRQKVVDCTC